ncbi:MAG TPA: hypothetical protein VMT86_11465 [Bryobacteraceae bacterium]|nr:hypothetical protein [Bryobacteraceae bacterium]
MRRNRLEALRLGQARDHFRQVPQTEDLNSLRNSRFGRVIRRHDEPGHAAALRADCDRQRATHRAQRTIERQFAHKQVFVRGLGDAHGAQDADGHRQIESSAFLAHVGRSQVDGDRLVGITEAGVEQRRLDALAAFAHCRVRHADRDKVARTAGVHVYFHVDSLRLDAKQRGRTGSKECQAMWWDANGFFSGTGRAVRPC